MDREPEDKHSQKGHHGDSWWHQNMEYRPWTRHRSCFNGNFCNLVIYCDCVRECPCSREIYPERGQEVGYLSPLLTWSRSGEEKRIYMFTYIYMHKSFCMYISMLIYIQWEGGQRKRLQSPTWKMKALVHSKWICPAILITQGALWKGNLKKPISSCFQSCRFSSGLSPEDSHHPHIPPTLKEDWILERLREELFSDN